MANLVKNFLGYLKLNDDDDFDEDMSDYEEKEKEKLENIEKRSSRTSQPIKKYEDNPSAEPKRERTRMERTSSNKIVPIRTTTKGLEVCIMKPTSFDDSKDICDILLSSRACVVNLEGFDVDVAQRIMDFISGAVYALNGKLHQISNYIFIISPETIDISGDYLELIPDSGFEVPTLNKEF